MLIRYKICRQSLNRVNMFQASATAIHASVVPAHVSPKYVTIIITSVFITCVMFKDVNPVSGVGIVLLTVVKAAIVEPVIGLTDHVHHVKMDIGVSSATSGAWRVVNHAIQMTNVSLVKKDFGEIHALNVKDTVLIRAIRYLVYVRKDVKRVSGEIIATTHALTDAMTSV